MSIVADLFRFVVGVDTHTSTIIDAASRLIDRQRFSTSGLLRASGCRWSASGPGAPPPSSTARRSGCAARWKGRYEPWRRETDSSPGSLHGVRKCEDEAGCVRHALAAAADLVAGFAGEELGARAEANLDLVETAPLD